MGVTKNYLLDSDTWFVGDKSKVLTIDIYNNSEFSKPENVANEWSAAKDGGTIMCYQVADSEKPDFLKLYVVGDNIHTTDATKLFYNFTKVKTISGVEKIDFSEATSFAHLFENCRSLTHLYLNNVNTSSITDMSYAFAYCSSLRELEVSDWDVSGVTTFNMTFCTPHSTTSGSKLTNLDVSKWDTSSAIDMSWMFWGCDQLGTLDVSGFDVSNVTSFNHTFAHCKLRVIDTSRWKNSVVTDFNAMFVNNLIEFIDLRGFDTSNVQKFDQMFEGNYLLKRILGIDKFNTANGWYFCQMFKGCTSLRKLDLSSFSTEGLAPYIDENGRVPGQALTAMFEHCHNLYEIILGKNFYFFESNAAHGSYANAVLDSNRGYFLPIPVNIIYADDFCGLRQKEPLKAQGDGFYSYIEGAEYSSESFTTAGVVSVPTYEVEAKKDYNFYYYYNENGEQIGCNIDDLKALFSYGSDIPRTGNVTLFANKYGKSYERFDDAMEELADIVREKTGFKSELDIGNIVKLVSELGENKIISA